MKDLWAGRYPSPAEYLGEEASNLVRHNLSRKPRDHPRIKGGFSPQREHLRTRWKAQNRVYILLYSASFLRGQSACDRSSWAGKPFQVPRLALTFF